MDDQEVSAPPPYFGAISAPTRARPPSDRAPFSRAPPLALSPQTRTRSRRACSPTSRARASRRRRRSRRPGAGAARGCRPRAARAACSRRCSPRRARCRRSARAARRPAARAPTRARGGAAAVATARADEVAQDGRGARGVAASASRGRLGLALPPPAPLATTGLSDSGALAAPPVPSPLVAAAQSGTDGELHRRVGNFLYLSHRSDEPAAAAAAVLAGSAVAGVSGWPTTSPSSSTPTSTRTTTSRSRARASHFVGVDRTSRRLISGSARTASSTRCGASPSSPSTAREGFTVWKKNVKTARCARRRRRSSTLFLFVPAARRSCASRSTAAR